MSFYVGIDPGKTGSLAIIADDEPMVTMSLSDPDWIRLITSMDRSEIARVVVEKVRSMPGQGVASMFKFGTEYGRVLGALQAAMIPYDEAPPKVWQKSVGLVYPRGSKRSERKRLGLKRARELFPGHDITLEQADSCLIAEYARRSVG